MTEKEANHQAPDQDGDGAKSGGEPVADQAEVPAAAPAEEEAKDGLKPTPVVWISAVLSFFFLLGVYDFVTSSSEANKCTMTYMFEYPEYVQVKLPEEIRKEFPRYNLYVYSEGKLVDFLKENQFEGIPVLFIPGNAGSYKQVRSLASVALRKAIDETKYKTHFDFFTLDFAEEMSGIYGGVLQDQSRFASLCVAEILKLYTGQLNEALSEASTSTAIPPESVLVIGHSIGGLVARSLFLHADFEAAKVNTILTLATPHRPVIVTDWDLQKFYNDVNSYWKINNSTTLSHVTLVSIGGGFRDTQVRADLALHDSANISVITTSAPSVWVSTDHLCIVWCKQLVMALNRVLFDLINTKTQQLTFDKDLRQKIFEYHLVQRSAGKQYKSVLNGGGELHVSKFKFDLDGLWMDLIKRQFVYKSTSKKWAENARTTNLMIKAFDDPKHEELTLDAVNMDLDDWVFGCKANSVHKGNRVCETGDNLSHLSYIIPSNGKRKTLKVSLKDLRIKYGYTHVVVVIPKSLPGDVRVYVDVYNPADRTVEAHLPRFITFYTSQVLVPRTIPNAVTYNISLKGMVEMWQAYTIQVIPKEGKCKSNSHFGIMQFKTTWDQETTQALIGHNMTNKLTVKLQTPMPGVPEGETAPTNFRTDVIFYLNPSCVYSIGVRPAIPEMWGQIVRFFYPMMLSFMTSVTLMAFANQLKLVGDPDKASPEPKFHSFFVVLGSKVSPMSAVMPCRLLAAILSSAMVASKLPFVTDFALMTESGTDFSLLPILLFFVSIGMMFVVSAAAWACILAFGNAANTLLGKFVAQAVPAANETVIDVAISTIEKFPFILSLILVAVGAGSCGTLALCLGTFAHFVHLFNMYKDFLKSKLFKVRDQPAEGEVEEGDWLQMGRIHFQFSLALLWVLTTLLNAPSLMAWIHSLESGFNLQKDPSQITALILCLSLPYLWGDNRPNLNLSNYNNLSAGIQFFSILTLLYGSLTVYRVNYFICAVFVCTALHQMMAGPRPEPVPVAAAVTEEAEAVTDDQN